MNIFSGCLEITKVVYDWIFYRIRFTTLLEVVSDCLEITIVVYDWIFLYITFTTCLS